VLLRVSLLLLTAAAVVVVAVVIVVPVGFHRRFFPLS
jgi:hypothetical protein